jgi:hypothetical protein
MLEMFTVERVTSPSGATSDRTSVDGRGGKRQRHARH